MVTSPYTTANTGRNTNMNHFSIMQGDAHHLDGKYTIFGEVGLSTTTGSCDWSTLYKCMRIVCRYNIQI